MASKALRNPTASIDDEDLGAMSVAELLRKAKVLMTTTAELHQTKKYVKELEIDSRSKETLMNSLQSRLVQKDQLIKQYEKEIETMTQLLQDAEQELDRAHQERLSRSNSVEEVQRLQRDVHTYQEKLQTQGKTVAELQAKILHNEEKNRALETSIQTLQKKLSDAQNEVKQMRQFRHTKEKELSSKESLCSSIRIKLKKEEQDHFLTKSKLDETQRNLEKSLDALNKNYMINLHHIKELKKFQDLGKVLMGVLQEMQTGLVDRQLQQITEHSEGTTEITMDLNLQTVLKKLWDMQEQLYPSILLQIHDPSLPEKKMVKRRGRPKSTASCSSGRVDQDQSEPVAADDGNSTQFQANNRLLLKCLDLLAKAHRDMSDKENALANKESALSGMEAQLSIVREQVRNQEGFYTIHVYQQDKDGSQASEAPVTKVITSYSAVSNIQEQSPGQSRMLTPKTSDIDAYQNSMIVRMECDTDGEEDQESRTLAIQTSPMNVDVANGPSGVKTFVISDTDDDDEDACVILPYGGNPAPQKLQLNASAVGSKDPNSTMPSSSVLTNVTTIPQDMFDNIGSLSKVSPSGAEDSSQIRENCAAQNDTKQVLSALMKGIKEKTIDVTKGPPPGYSSDQLTEVLNLLKAKTQVPSLNTGEVKVKKEPGEEESRTESQMEEMEKASSPDPCQETNLTSKNCLADSHSNSTLSEKTPEQLAQYDDTMVEHTLQSGEIPGDPQRAKAATNPSQEDLEEVLPSGGKMTDTVALVEQGTFLSCPEDAPAVNSDSKNLDKDSMSCSNSQAALSTDTEIIDIFLVAPADADVQKSEENDSMILSGTGLHSNTEENKQDDLDIAENDNVPNLTNQETKMVDQANSLDVQISADHGNMSIVDAKIPHEAFNDCHGGDKVTDNFALSKTDDNTPPGGDIGRSASQVSGKTCDQEKLVNSSTVRSDAAKNFVISSNDFEHQCPSENNESLGSESPFEGLHGIDDMTPGASCSNEVTMEAKSKAPVGKSAKRKSCDESCSEPLLGEKKQKVDSFLCLPCKISGNVWAKNRLNHGKRSSGFVDSSCMV